jgi:hypothetical protein
MGRHTIGDCVTESNLAKCMAVALPSIIVAHDSTRSPTSCQYPESTVYLRPEGTRLIGAIARESVRKFLRSVAYVPVPDICIGALTAGLVIGSQGVEIEFFAMCAGILVMIVAAPRVLADVLQVAARAPVTDRRIGRLLQEGRETLLRGRVFRVVELEHGKRGFETLYVLFSLGNSGPFNLPDNFRYDDSGQQADYDHDYHDLDKGESACTREI